MKKRWARLKGLARRLSCVPSMFDNLEVRLRLS